MIRRPAPVLIALLLAACGGSRTPTDTAPQAAATQGPNDAAQAAALAQAKGAHDAARKELDGVWNAIAHPDALGKAQSAWEDSLKLSCASVTPALEQVNCETRLITARAADLKARYGK